MRFSQPLEATQLVKRYKRFLADVIHPENGAMTVHCANTGSMKNCWQPGWQAWVLDSHNPKRKYRYSWVVSQNEQGEMIGINTHLANDLVFEGINQGRVKQLSNFETVKKEVKYGEENSRIDILLTDKEQRLTFVEVKSVTLLEDDGLGYFPDAKTVRGQKHIRELIHCVTQGHRAVLFFMVQHSGIKSVSVARHIDPDYAELLTSAIEAGVEVICYDSKISRMEIALRREVEFIGDEH